MLGKNINNLVSINLENGYMNSAFEYCEAVIGVIL